MQTALRLARRGLGSVWPNPAVGCILVREDQGGRFVGRGWTQLGGRPHAETEALKRAGDLAKGSTAYVSLEPCNHTGKTGPCTDALIKAGVKRVVVATKDPDPRVAGAGIAKLKEAGIETEIDICRDDADDLNKGFMTRINKNRPMMTLKLATSLDGKIATHTRHSRWITGPLSRAHAHRLRSENDAVLIGSETAITDDPELTCRLEGLDANSPVRIVLDSRLRLSPNSKLAQSAKDVPVWVVTTKQQDTVTQDELKNQGVEIIELDPQEGGRPDLEAVCNTLAERGLTRVLIEGGGGVAGSFFRKKLIDEVIWFRAPKLIGADGISALDALGIETMDQAPEFISSDVFKTGDDTVETYRRVEG
jgi:diaminohydroxyphosphoribosylaminopyrimidine deaminase/5-amino-6-(5-phosphoribosylamino)uracil reductase